MEMLSLESNVKRKFIDMDPFIQTWVGYLDQNGQNSNLTRVQLKLLNVYLFILI